MPEAIQLFAGRSSLLKRALEEMDHNEPTVPRFQGNSHYERLQLSKEGTVTILLKADRWSYKFVVKRFCRSIKLSWTNIHTGPCGARALDLLPPYPPLDGPGWNW